MDTTQIQIKLPPVIALPGPTRETDGNRKISFTHYDREGAKIPGQYSILQIQFEISRRFSSASEIDGIKNHDKQQSVAGIGALAEILGAESATIHPNKAYLAPDRPDRLASFRFRPTICDKWNCKLCYQLKIYNSLIEHSAHFEV